MKNFIFDIYPTTSSEAAKKMMTLFHLGVSRLITSWNKEKEIFITKESCSYKLGMISRTKRQNKNKERTTNLKPETQEQQRKLSICLGNSIWLSSSRCWLLFSFLCGTHLAQINFRIQLGYPSFTIFKAELICLCQSLNNCLSKILWLFEVSNCLSSRILSWGLSINNSLFSIFDNLLYGNSLFFRGC